MKESFLYEQNKQVINCNICIEDTLASIELLSHINQDDFNEDEVKIDWATYINAVRDIYHFMCKWTKEKLDDDDKKMMEDIIENFKDSYVHQLVLSELLF